MGLKKWILLFGFVALLPWGFRLTSFADYLTYILVRMMILGLYAMSYDLIFGYGGIFSYGHASFMGGGAYCVAILMVQLGLPIRDALPGILLGVFSGIIIGWIMGFLSSRLGSPLAVFLVTFAVSEVLFLLVTADPLGITNGENGIARIPRETIFGSVSIKSELNFYYLALVVLCLSFLTLRMITRMPFGDTLQAIRENPQRSLFLGYRIRLYRIAAFMISGAFASMAGALTALHERSVGPEMFSMLSSAEVFIYTVLGGPGTLVGPLVGALIMVIIQEVLSDILHKWVIFFGLICIVLIMFLPKGLFPLFKWFRVGRTISG